MIAKEKKSTSVFIEPMEVTQSLIGLGLDDTDVSVLEYFNFFVEQVPTSAAYFMHVLPKFDLEKAMYRKESEVLSSWYSLSDDLVKEMEEEINEIFVQKKKLYVEYEIKEGNPLEEMLKISDTLKIDLLVIGQKKNKPNHNILAKNLARKTTANALVIPENATKDISNILVPIDFSPNSVRALQAAISLHKQLDRPAMITCLNVYTIPSLQHFKLDSGWIQTKKTVESNIRDGFEAFLTSFAGDYKNKIKVDLVEKTRPGIAEYITDYAKENNNDFICLGAKGHSNVHLLLMGSVAEEVLDTNNSIPTLIVK